MRRVRMMGWRGRSKRSSIAPRACVEMRAHYFPNMEVRRPGVHGRSGMSEGGAVGAVFIRMLDLAIQRRYARSDTGFEQYPCAPARRARKGSGWCFGWRKCWV